ncbi:MAG: FHA domain-containing protein [Verrucomicrobiia bacterium]
MVHPELPELLQRHCESNRTGCLFLSSPTQGQGRIYVQDGKPAHAEVSHAKGLHAFFLMLTWADAEVEWQPGSAPPRISITGTVDELLYHFAQLEDSQQTDPETLRRIFDKTDSQEINLTEIKNYEISFEVLNTEFKGFRFFLSKPMTLIGRAEDCDVILPDPSVSSHHTSLVLETNCILVRDLGSTNGTFINEKLVNEGVMQLGDHLHIGGVSLQMHMKLIRNLKSAESVQTASIPTVSPEVKKRADLKLTSKISAKPTKRPVGPITWENVQLNRPAKGKPNNSLIGRLFSGKR